MCRDSAPEARCEAGPEETEAVVLAEGQPPYDLALLASGEFAAGGLQLPGCSAITHSRVSKGLSLQAQHVRLQV